jgi:zinc transporter, ZIP family
MSFAQTAILAAFAGGTIFLGLPVGRLGGLSPRLRVALLTAAAGVVLFLIYDVLAEAVEPVDKALAAARAGGSYGEFGLNAGVLAGSVAFGLLSVTYFTQRLSRRAQQLALEPRQMAMSTAAGLGLHNLAEGLAIGQSAATGATTLALILVVGFALHNATEGLAIAAPLSLGPKPSWRFLALAGLVGGGPTFLGGMIGYSFVAPLLSIAFLGLAAGALVFVFNEVMAVSRKFALPMITGAALTLGLIVAFGTDFLLSAAGA